MADRLSRVWAVLDRHRDGCGPKVSLERLGCCAFGVGSGRRSIATGREGGGRKETRTDVLGGEEKVGGLFLGQIGETRRDTSGDDEGVSRQDGLEVDASKAESGLEKHLGALKRDPPEPVQRRTHSRGRRQQERGGGRQRRRQQREGQQREDGLRFLSFSHSSFFHSFPPASRRREPKEREERDEFRRRGRVEAEVSLQQGRHASRFVEDQPAPKPAPLSL